MSVFLKLLAGKENELEQKPVLEARIVSYISQNLHHFANTHDRALPITRKYLVLKYSMQCIYLLTPRLNCRVCWAP